MVEYSYFANIASKGSELGELFAVLALRGLPAEEAFAAKMAMRRDWSMCHDSEQKEKAEDQYPP